MNFELYSFNTLLIVMTVLAVIVFIALHFIDAGYGIMFSRRWGPAISNRIGWVMMESPVFIAMTLLWWFSDRTMEVVPLIFFSLFQLHYLQRSFIFPFLMKGKSKMPLSIIVSGITFNLINAIMQGGWIFYISPASLYNIDWLYSPQFIAGVSLFFVGMAININSDNIIRNLRKPGDTKHYLPHGGLFNYVTSANYFGEVVEWSGFAILTWSWSGAVFALWTFANLAPRATKIHKRYTQEFGEDFQKLKRHRIIPFIY